MVEGITASDEPMLGLLSQSRRLPRRCRRLPRRSPPSPHMDTGRLRLNTEEHAILELVRSIDFDRPVATIETIRTINPHRYEFEMLTAVVYIDSSPNG